MKKLTSIFLTIMFTLSTIHPQDTESSDPVALDKTKVAGFSFLGPIIGLYSGSIGFYQKNGKVEIKVPVFYWKIPESLMKVMKIYGAGAHYRMYSKEGGEGFFWGPVVKAQYFNWDVWEFDWFGEYPLDELDDDGYAYTGESISGTLFEAGLEIGRRWQWKSGLTIAPTFGYNFGFGSISASESGVEADFDAGGLQYSLGLGWAF